MKKIFCLVFVLFAAFSAFAQQDVEKVIEKPEFDTVFQGSYMKLMGQSYRKTVTTQQSIEGKPANDVLTKSTVEVIPQTGYHYIYESTSQSKKINFEKIVFKDKTYSREGKEAWKPGAGNDPASLMSEDVSAITSTEVVYKFSGNQKLNDRNTKAYTVIENNKYLNPKTNVEFVSVITNKYWFTDSGELLKTERTAKTRTSKSVLNEKAVTTYEVDPKIKIEAPK